MHLRDEISPQETAIVMLASGASVRFGDADKLLAMIDNMPVAAHAAARCEGKWAWRFAIVPENAPARRTLFEERGWACIENPSPEKGLASSLRLGMSAAQSTIARALIVVLADMPFLPMDALMRLVSAAQNADAVFSTDGTITGPPGLLRRGVWDQILSAEGDVGLGGTLPGEGAVGTVHFHGATLIDIDTPEDLAKHHA